MAVGNAELAILISAKDAASGTIDKVGGKLGKFGGAAKLAKVGLLGIGAVGAVAAVGLFKVGADFDKAFDTIKVGTGATGEALKSLQGDMKSVFKSVPTDLGSASTAISELNTRLGLTGEPLRQLSKQVLEMSRITKTDLGQNIEGVTRLFGDWGVATEDQAAALDRVFKTSQATGPSVSRLSELMVSFGAPLRQLNFTFEESAALMGKWEQEGVNTELVMGSLKIAIAKFAKEGVPLRQGLEDTIAKIQELGPGAEATSLAMERFGARAGGDMAAAILEGKFAIDDLLATLDEGGAGILETAKSTESLGEKFTRLKNTALVAIQPLATGFFDGLSKLATLIEEKVVPVVKAFIDLFKATVQKDFKGMKIAFAGIPEPLKGIARVVIQVARFVRGDLIPALKGIADFIVRDVVPQLKSFAETALEIARAVLPIIVDALGTLMRGWQQLFEDVIRPVVLPLLEKLAGFLLENKEIIFGVAAVILLLLNPWLLVIGVIIAVLAKWDEIKAVFTKTIPNAIDSFIEKVKEIPVIGDIVGAAAKIVVIKVEAIIAIFKGLMELVVEVIAFIKAIFKGDWAAAWESMKEIAKIALNLFINFLRTTFLTDVVVFFRDLGPQILAALGALGGLLWQKGRDLLRGFASGYLNVWWDVLSFFRQVVGRIMTALGNMGSRLWTHGWNLITGFWNGIIRQWGNMRRWIRDRLQDLVDMFTNFFGIFSPSRVFEGIGENMIKGLIAGLEGQTVKLNATVGSVTGGIVGSAVGGGAAARGGAPRTGAREVHVHVHSRFPPDRRLLRSEAIGLRDEFERIGLLG